MGEPGLIHDVTLEANMSRTPEIESEPPLPTRDHHRTQKIAPQADQERLRFDPGALRRPFVFHVHTKPRSIDANWTAEEAILFFEKQGAQGILFAEHGALWSPQELQQLKILTRTKLVLLAGREVAMRDAHIIVVGASLDMTGPRPERASELAALVRKQRGATILAHPSQHKVTPEQACEWGVNAVEVFNASRDSWKEADWSHWEHHALTLVAGMDAHFTPWKRRLCFTEVPRAVETEQDLARALRYGRVFPTIVQEDALPAPEEIRQAIEKAFPTGKNQPNTR